MCACVYHNHLHRHKGLPKIASFSLFFMIYLTTLGVDKTHPPSKPRTDRGRQAGVPRKTRGTQTANNQGIITPLLCLALATVLRTRTCLPSQRDHLGDTDDIRQSGGGRRRGEKRGLGFSSSRRTAKSSAFISHSETLLNVSGSGVAFAARTPRVADQHVSLGGGSKRKSAHGLGGWLGRFGSHILFCSVRTGRGARVVRRRERGVLGIAAPCGMNWWWFWLACRVEGFGFGISPLGYY